MSMNDSWRIAIAMARRRSPQTACMAQNVAGGPIENRNSAAESRKRKLDRVRLASASQNIGIAATVAMPANQACHRTSCLLSRPASHPPTSAPTKSAPDTAKPHVALTCPSVTCNVRIMNEGRNIDSAELVTVEKALPKRMYT